MVAPPLYHWLSPRVYHFLLLPLGLSVGGLITRLFYNIIHNLFFHPLRSYPGPILWRISSLPSNYLRFHGTAPQAVAVLHAQYGPCVRIAPDELSFSTSEARKTIFAHRPGKAEFPKDPFSLNRNANGLTSILSADKEDHARFRRLLALAFSDKGLRDQKGLVMQYVDLLVDRLSDFASRSASVDLVEWYDRTVFDVTGDLAFGKSFDCLRNSDTHDWVPAVPGNTVFFNQTNALKHLGVSFLAPYVMPKVLQTKRMNNYKYAQNRVDERLKLDKVRGDFWDRVMIKSVDSNKSGEGMSEGEMLNNASMLMGAGTETTSSTLSAATYLLLKNPHAMSRLRDELRTAFDSSSAIDFASTLGLQYLHAVLEETMRVYPPVPTTGARVVPSGGATIEGEIVPAGTTVNVSNLAAHHDPSNFHRADEFLPDRWLADGPTEYASDNTEAFAPFSLGTRNCIGRNLAYAEARLVLAKVFWHFDITLDDSKTGAWFDQKAYGQIWLRNPLWATLSAVRE